MFCISDETKETFSPREKIMYRALEIVGKMLRENPMGDIDCYPPELLAILPNGDSRDPDGKEYISYFILGAVRELKEEGEIINGTYKY